MPDELDVNAVSSPAPDVTAPSAEPVAPSETTPPSPSQAVPVEEAKIPLSRLNEVIEQRKAAEAREAQLLEALRQARVPVQPTAQPVNFWEGRINHPDLATANYWQQQKQMFDLAKQEATQEVEARLAPVINAGRSEIARLNTERFREKNPGITVGSEDERLIISYMSGQVDGVQHPLESAKRNAMYDRLEAENRALKSKQTAIPRKAAANVETSPGIPETAGLPGKPGGWRQEAEEAFDASKGDTLAVVNAITTRKR